MTIYEGQIAKTHVGVGEEEDERLAFDARQLHHLLFCFRVLSWEHKGVTVVAGRFNMTTHADTKEGRDEWIINDTPQNKIMDNTQVKSTHVYTSGSDRVLHVPP